MKRTPRSLSALPHRRGTSTVEVAFITPVFFLFVLGLMQVCHALMIGHVLRGVCREAARFGSTEGVTTAQVEAYAHDLTSSIVLAEDVDIIVRNAGVFDESGGDLPQASGDYGDLPEIELSEAEARQMFLVRATVNYNDVAIVDLPFFENLSLTGMAFMRHE